MPLTNEELVPLTMEALGYAMAGDADRASDTLDRIGEAADGHQRYGVCCAFATAATHALGIIQGRELPGDAMWVMQETEPGGLAADPHVTFAVRFIVAHANHDEDTTLALYRATLDAGPEAHVESIVALLANAAELLVLAEREKAKREEAGRS